MVPFALGAMTVFTGAGVGFVSVAAAAFATAFVLATGAALVCGGALAKTGG